MAMNGNDGGDWKADEQKVLFAFRGVPHGDKVDLVPSYPEKCHQLPEPLRVTGHGAVVV